MTAQPQGHAYLLRNIPPDLMRRIKIAAAERRITIRELIFKALTEFLKK